MSQDPHIWDLGRSGPRGWKLKLRGGVTFTFTFGFQGQSELSTFVYGVHSGTSGHTVLMNCRNYNQDPNPRLFTAGGDWGEEFIVVCYTKNSPAGQPGQWYELKTNSGEVSLWDHKADMSFCNELGGGSLMVCCHALRVEQHLPAIRTEEDVTRELAIVDR